MILTLISTKYKDHGLWDSNAQSIAKWKKVVTLWPNFDYFSFQASTPLISFLNREGSDTLRGLRDEGASTDKLVLY